MSKQVEPYIGNPVSAEEAVKCLRGLIKQIQQDSSRAYSVSGECQESFVQGIYRHSVTVAWTQEKQEVAA